MTQPPELLVLQGLAVSTTRLVIIVTKTMSLETGPLTTSHQDDSFGHWRTALVARMTSLVIKLSSLVVRVTALVIRMGASAVETTSLVIGPTVVGALALVTWPPSK